MSLVSPVAVESLRWRGNPFAGAGEGRGARVFDLGEAYPVRRVAAGSVHHAAVASGSLKAETADGRAALAGWLVERMREIVSEGRGTLDLAGVWPVVEAGGRIAVAGEALRVERVVWDFVGQGTRVEVL